MSHRRVVAQTTGCRENGNRMPDLQHVVIRLSLDNEIFLISASILEIATTWPLLQLLFRFLRDSRIYFR